MDIEFEIVEGPLKSNPEIVLINYDLNTLTLEVEPEFDGEPIIVAFELVEGIRVLDEGNLLEFWDSFNLNSGWIFRIVSGGWFSQELNRPGFLSLRESEVMEYIVIGENECVSVLTYSEPKVTYPGTY